MTKTLKESLIANGLVGAKCDATRDFSTSLKWNRCDIIAAPGSGKQLLSMLFSN
jgi:hypothetical protein